MGLWDYVKRGALAVGTGGLSEAGGFRTVDDVTGQHGQKAAGGVVGFLKDTYGNPDDVNVAVDSADYDKAAATFDNYDKWLQGQNAYHYNWRQADQARGLLANAAQGYQATINGSAPSLAQQQMQQGMANAQAQAQQMAASARGGPGAALLAQQAAQRTGAGLALASTAQAAALRAQEVNAAQQGLMQAGTSLYGLDQQRQQMQAQAYQNNQALQNQGLLASAQGRQGVASQYATDKLNAQLGTTQINSQAQAAAADRRAGALTQLGQIISKSGGPKAPGGGG